MFRGEVGVLADHGVALLVVHEVKCLGDAEVGELYVPFAGDHNVARSHVAVDDSQQLAIAVTLLMCVGEAPADPRHDEHCEVHRQVLLVVDVHLGELFKVYAVDELHGHEVLAVHLAKVVGLHDVGVDQVRHQLGFAHEIVAKFIDRRVLLADQLQRHHLAEVTGSMLKHLVHHAHPSGCDGGDDFQIQ